MRTRVMYLAVAVGLAVLLGSWAGNVEAQQRKVVRVWHTEPNPASVSAIKEIIADFEKLHPDITIQPEAVGWNELLQKLIASLAAGNPPEAAHVQPVTLYSYYGKGMIEPLDELVKSIGENDIYDQIREISYWDGHYWGLTHAWGTRVLIYNKAAFAAAGLKPPRNWDEWARTLQAIQEPDQGGKIKRHGMGLAGGRLFINLELWMWLGSNGGRFFDDKGRPTLTEKPMIETLELYKKVAEKAPPGWVAQTYTGTFTELVTGKVAMISGCGRGVGYIVDHVPPDVANPDNYGLLWKPLGPSGKKLVTELDAEQFAIFKQAPNKKEAMEFLKFFYRPENYIKYLHSVPTHLLSIRKSVRSDPRYLAHPWIKKWGPWIEQQEEYMQQGIARPYFLTRKEDIKVPYIAEFEGSNILPDMVLDVVVEKMSPQAAAAKAQRRTEDLIKQLGFTIPK